MSQRLRVSAIVALAVIAVEVVVCALFALEFNAVFVYLCHLPGTACSF